LFPAGLQVGADAHLEVTNPFFKSALFFVSINPGCFRRCFSRNASTTIEMPNRCAGFKE